MEYAGEVNCSHEWIVSNEAVLTSPLIYHQICSKCGRVEHVHNQTYYKDIFDITYRKFHRPEIV